MSSKLKNLCSIISNILIVIIIIFAAIVSLMAFNAKNNDNIPSIFGYTTFSIQTDSMQGTINQGDLIVGEVVENPNDLEEGTIISFHTVDKDGNYYEYKPNFIVRFWRWGWGIYHKNEELWNYLIVGGLVTIVNMGTYFICTNTFCDPNVPIELQIANITSWVIAVLFAYITNRLFVFKSKSKGKEQLREFTSFVGMRVLSLGMDMAGMALMVSLLHWNDALSKVLIQVIVVLSNYVFSKLFVFKKKD